MKIPSDSVLLVSPLLPLIS